MNLARPVKKLFLSIFFVLISPNVFSWTITSNFESGNTGDLAQGNDGFSEAFSQSVLSKEYVLEGTQSMKSSITNGSTGFGDWGGLWRLPTALRENDEFWFRVWALFPNGFDFSCNCSEGVKFMRARTASSSGAHEGYQNYFLSTQGMVVATSVNTNEFYDRYSYPFEDIRGIGDNIEEGTWHAYEMYLKLSGTPGQGIFRAWQDGKLVFEDTNTATLRSSSSKLTQASIWTFWNNNAPKSQSAFVDNVIITSERPSKQDADGNFFIGLENNLVPSTLSSPKPPTSVNISVN